MADVVREWLRGINECMVAYEDRIGHRKWKDDYPFWLDLATYRNRQYNDLVQERVMLFHDWVGNIPTHVAASIIISVIGWNRNAVALIHAHWIAYEGYNEHARKYKKNPVDLEAYITAALAVEHNSAQSILSKEY